MKKRFLALALATLMLLLTIPTNIYADTEMGGGLPANTEDNSVDDSSISVVAKLIVKSKKNGEILYQEEIYPNIDASVQVAAANVGDLTADYISQVSERAVQKALEYVDENNIPECKVEGDITYHDNRTYTMQGQGTDDLKMVIAGNYGAVADYVITLEVITDKEEVNIVPDTSDEPQPTYEPLVSGMDEKSVNPAPFIIGGVVLLLIIGAAVYFFVFKNKKK